MYMFPRQFALHNVFTCDVDSRQTVQPFQDYTLREDEISGTFAAMPRLPRRLRGKAAELVAKLQLRHSRCSYKELLDYYCPVRSIISAEFLN
jgi:telomerase reverse transcriptase